MDQALAYIYEIENPAQQDLFLKVHDVISNLLPHVRTRLKYKIPFYIYFGNLCYLNPYKDQLYIGFVEGYLLAPRELLTMENTNTIAKYHIKDQQDIMKEELREILLEAAIINEQKQAEKK